MSDAGFGSKFGSWSAPESPITVEYSLVVIEEIRHDVSEGLRKLSRGGVEVSGVLYGTRNGRTVDILAMRPISSEHARGPAFLLSDADKEALEEQLREDREDRRLEGLICVGWFLSHTRSEIQLTESDMEIYSTYFGAPWQVTLVIRPGRGGSMRGGFFVREDDGRVQTERSYLEFNFPDRLAGVLDRPPRLSRVEGERSAGVRLTRERATALAPVERERPRGSPAPVEATGEATVPELLLTPPVVSRWPWVAVAIVALVAVALGGWRFYLSRLQPEPIGLSVLERNGQLQIGWNHLARPVTAAVRGTLTIEDGGATRTLDLSPQELANGGLTWQQKSGDVQVGLSVQDSAGNKTEEATRFLGRPPVPPADSGQVKALTQQRDDLQAEVDQLRRDNAAQTQRVRELERMLRILQTRLGIK
jgi:proteasome lid subunit RPN8/RPN11